MANIVDRKWNSGREIDDEDPLMQLSRIMSESSARENERTSNAISEADLDPDFNFDDDFSSALDDAIIEEDDVHYAAQPTEISLEDELAALLSDAPVVPAPRIEAPTPRVDAVIPPYQQAFEEARFEQGDLSSEHAAAPQINADTEIVDDQFEADPWLDIDFDEPVAMATAGPELTTSPVNEAVDPVLAHMHYNRGNARYVAEEQAVLPVSSIQNDNTEAEAFEFELEPELAHLAEVAIAAENPIEFARGNLVPPAPEFEEWQPEVALAPSEPEPTFDFTEDFDRLLAETAPEPMVEATVVTSDRIAATEEFDIPDFEFSDEPEITGSQSHDSDEDYRGYEAPVAKAFVASTTLAYASQIQVQSPAVESDVDFESVLNDELSADLDGTIGGYQPDEIPGISSKSSYRSAAPYQANPADEFEPFTDENGGFATAAYHEEPTKSRSWLSAAVIAGALVLCGAGYYAYSKTGTSVVAAGGPVLVKADTQPVKVAPEVPGGKVVADQDKAVYDKVAGAGDAPATPGQLITASEEPVDIAAVASDPVEEGDNADTQDAPVTAKIVMPAAAATPATAAAVATKGKAEDRVDPALDPENAPVASADATAVAPKKVRTFVVKPDGSLVERAAAPVPVAPVVAPVETAAADPAPVVKIETPAPAVVEAKPVTKPMAKSAEPPAVEPAKVVETQEVAATPEAKAPAVEKVASAIKVVKTKKIKAPKSESETLNADAATGAAPIIDARPADQPVTIVGKTGGKKPAAETQVAAADAAPQPTADQTPAATGAYVIQIASTPSAEAAKATYAALSRKFSGVIGGRGVNIQQAEVAGKGTVFRVRINAGSKQDATALCSQYKSSGGSCFVSK